MKNYLQALQCDVQQIHGFTGLNVATFILWQEVTVKVNSASYSVLFMLIQAMVLIISKRFKISTASARAIYDNKNIKKLLELAS